MSVREKDRETGCVCVCVCVCVCERESVRMGDRVMSRQYDSIRALPHADLCAPHLGLGNFSVLQRSRSARASRTSGARTAGSASTRTSSAMASSTVETAPTKRVAVSSYDTQTYFC